MEVWSKGLGTRKLNLRLGQANVEDCGDSMVIRGKMGPPVYWDFSITMTEEDLDDILHVATQRGTISFLLSTKKRWSLYFTAVKQVVKLVLKFVVGFVRRLGRRRAPRTASQ
jgi:hypothetical protein